MRHHRTVLGLGVLLVGIATGVLALAAADRDAAHPPPAPRAARATAEPRTPSLDAVPLQAGQRWRYAVDAGHDVDLGGDALAVQVAGTWQLTVLRADGDGVLLESELAASVSIGPARQRATADPAVAAELARPHYLTLDPQGRVTSFQFSPDQRSLARGVVRSLATATQLVGAGAGGEQWDIEESDQTGRYLASYSRSGATIDKIKRSYTRVSGALEITELAAHTVFQAGGAVPASVSVDELLAGRTGKIALASRSRIALHLVGSDAVQPPERDLRGLDVVAVDGPAGSPRDRRDADRKLLAGATIAGLLADLAVDDDHVVASVGARLAALLRLEPARAAELAERVAGADPRTAGVILGALGTAGTAEAQTALVGLAGSSALAATDRAQVAVATTMVEHPTAELTEVLGGNLDAPDAELRSTSGLALGVAAARLAHDDAGRGQAIVDDLLARLADASDPAQQVLLLRALGNTGDARAIPALQIALSSTWPRVRGVAVETLRMFAGARVDDLIARALVDDPDPSVRRAAVFASSFRPIVPLLDTLGRALGSDRDVGVRLAVLRLLGDHLSVAGASALVDAAARRDPAEDVRAEARRLQSAG